MTDWLTEFQAFRAVINQANATPEAWDYKELCNAFIKRMEEIIDG